jgi:hypothetical protein
LTTNEKDATMIVSEPALNLVKEDLLRLGQLELGRVLHTERQLVQRRSKIYSVQVQRIQF